MLQCLLIDLEETGATISAFTTLFYNYKSLLEKGLIKISF